jgi:hypothetical protein
MRSELSMQDPRALDVCVRDAAASTPESGGTRQGLAGVAPGLRSLPSTRPQASAKRRGGACARDRGVKGGDRASSAAGAGRGRRGRSGELVSTPLSTKRRGNERGLLLIVTYRTRSDSGSGRRSEGAGLRRRRSRRRSGGRGRSSGRRQGREPAAREA